jgi:hypothetical protein
MPSFFFNGSTAPWGPRSPHLSWLHDHTLDTPQSVGLLWTRDQPVAETSTWQHTALTTDRHPCPPEGFEPTIPVSERPQTHVLDRAATGIGIENACWYKMYIYIDITVSMASSESVASMWESPYAMCILHTLSRLWITMGWLMSAESTRKKTNIFSKYVRKCYLIDRRQNTGLPLCTYIFCVPIGG